MSDPFLSISVVIFITSGPVPNKWCSVKNKCQLTDVALVDRYVAFEMEIGRWTGERRPACFLFTRPSGL